MRIQTTEVYKFEELSEEAKDKVIQRIKDERANDDYIPWRDEIMDSFKATFEAAGVTLRDWEVGPYCYSSCRVYMGDASELTGGRAMAWVENNLFGQFRVKRNTRESLRWGRFVGSRPECPMTGMSFDEDMFDSLTKALKTGDTLKEAFEGLADTAQKLMEEELDNYMSEETILDDLTNNGDEFTREGDRI